MHLIRGLYLFSLATVVLVAAEAPWQSKPMEQWDEQDARQVLAESPWVKFATPEHIGDKSPDQRRESGNWESGIGNGVGLIALIGMFGGLSLEEAIEKAHAKPTQERVAIRWESALPVRAAEKKVGEAGAPVLEKEHYAIVVYDIPTPKRWNLNNELKGVSYLRRTRKKDVRPSEVQVLRQDNGKATVVYLFPLKAEISKSDGRVEFHAQIGPLVVTQSFYPEDMQVRGETQL